MEIKRVGVVGCGLMGGGIAQVCAEAGYETVAREINDDLLNKGLNAIQTNWKKAVARGKMTEDEQAAALNRLKGTTSMKDFENCDLVIEAVIELMDLKKEVFSELDSIVPEHGILATNTSCLSIIEMASATKRPDKVMGIHFFNPVARMPLVEVVGASTSGPAYVAQALQFVGSLGKLPHRSA